MALPFQHFTKASQLTPEALGYIFPIAKKMEAVVKKKGRCDLAKDKVIAVLMYEPSTRTSLSFQSAAARLGAGCIVAQGKESSSMKKGESIEDTIRMVESFSDLIVMRHPEEGSANKAERISSVPFINGGDGGNEHPTQALLDVYTIYKEKGSLENLHVAFGFDPKHSRCVRSLAIVLSQYTGNTFTFISPSSLRMNDDLRELLTQQNIEFTETENLEEGTKADIFYINRLQEERFKNHDEFEQQRKLFVLHADHVKGKKVLIMSPLPRIDDIDVSVDTMPNAKYFAAAKNGIPTRMALLAMMLGKA